MTKFPFKMFEILMSSLLGIEFFLMFIGFFLTLFNVGKIMSVVPLVNISILLFYSLFTISDLMEMGYFLLLKKIRMYNIGFIGLIVMVIVVQILLKDSVFFLFGWGMIFIIFVRISMQTLYLKRIRQNRRIMPAVRDKKQIKNIQKTTQNFTIMNDWILEYNEISRNSNL
jgi:hypothetical protein